MSREEQIAFHKSALWVLVIQRNWISDRLSLTESEILSLVKALEELGVKDLGVDLGKDVQEAKKKDEVKRVPADLYDIY